MTSPEVISTFFYSGAGSGPLHADAAALNLLASRLESAVTSWTTTITELTGAQGWAGTGATAATAAAETYIDWLTDLETAVTAAATQAQAAAIAFDTARAAVIPPWVVIANRTEVNTLQPFILLPGVADLIAELELEYQGYTATDNLAYGIYMGDSGDAAAAVTAISLPASLPVPGAINLAADAPVGSAASIGDAASDFINSVDGLIGTPAIFNAVNGAVNTAAWFVMTAIPTAVSLGHVFASAAVPAAAVSDVVPVGAGGITEGTMVSSVAPLGLRANGMAGVGASASVGEASTIGKLSVPGTWAAATQTEAELASATAPLEGSGWTPAAETGGGPVMGAGMPGAAAGAKGAGAYGAGPRYGVKPIVMPKQVVV